ncbi:MAG TPA: Hint domain-containing protein [Acetobacteraceae bacterium]
MNLLDSETLDNVGITVGDLYGGLQEMTAGDTLTLGANASLEAAGGSLAAVGGTTLENLGLMILDAYPNGFLRGTAADMVNDGFLLISGGARDSWSFTGASFTNAGTVEIGAQGALIISAGTGSGTVADGTIAPGDGVLALPGATLDAIGVLATLDVGNGTSLYSVSIEGGLSAVGGQAGILANGGTLTLLDSETLDNFAIGLGYGGIGVKVAQPQGARAQRHRAQRRRDHRFWRADLRWRRYPDDAGSAYIQAAQFTNLGQIQVAGTDDLLISAPGFSNEGSISIAARATLELGIDTTLTGLIGGGSIANAAGELVLGGTLAPSVANIAANGGASSFVNVAGDTVVTLSTPPIGQQNPCFLHGTRILTQRGEVAVEALAVGDLVPVLLGPGLARVRWIGQRRVQCRRHPKPGEVQPVRIQKGAFGPGMPRRAVSVTRPRRAWGWRADPGALSLERPQHRPDRNGRGAVLACGAGGAQCSAGRGVAGGILSGHRQSRRVWRQCPAVASGFRPARVGQSRRCQAGDGWPDPGSGAAVSAVACRRAGPYPSTQQRLPEVGCRGLRPVARRPRCAGLPAAGGLAAGRTGVAMDQWRRIAGLCESGASGSGMCCDTDLMARRDSGCRSGSRNENPVMDRI